MLSGGGNFFLSNEQLLASPSRADAIDEECEFKLRLYGAELVQEGCILLKLCVAAWLCGRTSASPLTRFATQAAGCCRHCAGAAAAFLL
jgi:hypothetical protein